MILPEGDYIPPRCEHCKTTDWLYGIEPDDGIRVRSGVTFLPRRPDGHLDRRKEPGQGAKSLKRRERARRQYQALKPKELDQQPQP